MFLAQLCHIGLLAITCTAVPTPATYVLHEKRETAPRHWEKHSRVDQDLSLPVRIGLSQSSLDRGSTLLDEISTPGSPRYGQYLSPEEVHEMFAPSQEAVTVVSEWLHSSGIERGRVSQSVNKQWLQFDATALELEALLYAEFHHFKHVPTGRTSVACDQYFVPHHVKEHVDYVTPGLKLLTPSSSKDAAGAELEKRTFGVTGPTSNSSSTDSRPPILPPLRAKLPVNIQTLLSQPLKQSCPQAILPACISTLYNITAPTKAAKGNELGIFEDLGDVYSQSDLNSFFKNLAKNIPQDTHPTLDSIDGAVAPSTSAGPESNLDFQISYPIIYPQKSILFQTDDPVYEASYQFEGFLNNFLDAIDGSYCTYSAFGETGNSPLDPPYPNPAAGGYKGRLQCGVYKPTNVISISYGGQEADLPASYQQRQCNEYMKLGMQGVSVVVSSGDSGVSGPANDGNANGCLGDSGTIFSPDFPVTCPYVTAVGATFLPRGADVTKDQETAVTRFPSGGGFSNIFPIPSYQAAAVANYLKNSPPPYASYASTNNDSFGENGGIFNRNGRAYPDVSAIGDNVVVYIGGQAQMIGGTSASSPVFASILTRINEERLAAGKPTIGFANPTLYANPGALHDIVTGTNPGCGTQGFSCAEGWDPVTGLGTPDYPKLLDVFMS